MVRLTAYMKRQAARGNARVVQPTMNSAPTAPVLAVRDHAHRTRSGRELRALPVVVCLGCLPGIGQHRPVFAECRDAQCLDTAAGCEVCGSPPPLYDAPLTHEQARLRFGR